MNNMEVKKDRGHTLYSFRVDCFTMPTFKCNVMLYYLCSLMCEQNINFNTMPMTDGAPQFRVFLRGRLYVYPSLPHFFHEYGKEREVCAHVPFVACWRHNV